MFTFHYLANVNRKEQTGKKEIDLNLLANACLKYLFHGFEQSVCTASTPSAFCYFDCPFVNGVFPLKLNRPLRYWVLGELRL